MLPSTMPKEPDRETYSDRYVVRGMKGREHIFEMVGELITSLNRSNQAYLLKLRRGERRPITEEEFAVFQERFK